MLKKRKPVFLKLLQTCSIFFCALTPLFSSLDPSSVSEQLAFYTLYPETKEGKNALSNAWNLLAQSQGSAERIQPDLLLSGSVARSIVNLANRNPNDPIPDLTFSEL